MRIARAVSEWSTPFPQLSDDPLEQFLIVEAVMTRYEEQGRASAQLEADREGAREQAQALIDQAKGR